jgi:PhoPQ-activated pathogenicity-related protein
LALAVGAAIGRCEEAIPTALFDYVKKPEPDFAWKLEGSIQTGDGVIHEVRFTSQKWQDIVWKHALYVYHPKNVVAADHALVFVTGGRTGGSPSAADLQMGMQMAKLAGHPVAVLHHVPNQPLLGNKVEDDLITETFLRYIDSKDPNWPLLFPMVKSAVKAMDVVQALAKQEWKREIKSFCITGASKRGWTSWLSAAADTRIIGTAPIVIDTLNFRPQMKHQMATWGKYSEQIDDYSSKGLIDIMFNKPEIPLWLWVDPYTYRKQLTIPKLIVNGTNDPYWVVDALNLYWDDLQGPKSVFYVPNGNHGLGSGRERALATVSVFSRRTAAKKAMPTMNWKFDQLEKARKLTVSSDTPPKEALVWIAESPTKDFRPAKWTSRPMTAENGGFTATVDKPASGHQAIHAAFTFEDGAPFTLSTQIKWE